MNKHIWICWLILIPLAMTHARADSPAHKSGPYELNPDLPYQAKRSDPVTYDVDFSVVVTPPYHAKVLKVWLPLPQSDAGQEVVEKELGSFPLKIEPKIG